MRKTTATLSFEIPDMWTTFVDGRQFVAQGPDGEEIILSSWAVDGAPGPECGRLAKELLGSAKRAMESAADHAELRVTKPFGRDTDAGAGFPCWSLFAETTVRGTIFSQAAVRSTTCVMLVTFESPYSEKHADQFREFLAGIGPPK